MPEPEVDKALLSEITRGAEKTFTNAESLFQEASILREAGFLSRALLLHQVSLEECAKVDILGAAATQMLMGYELNIGELQKVLVRHDHKNRANAYFLEGTEEEKAAKESGDFDAAQEAFRHMQKEFHTKSNTAKNASLYVDFKDGKFVAPIECITAEMVSEIAALNEQFLGLSFNHVKLLRKFDANPEAICQQLLGFEDRMTELKEQFLKDPLRVMKIILQELRERSRQQ